MRQTLFSLAQLCKSQLRPRQSRKFHCQISTHPRASALMQKSVCTVLASFFVFKIFAWTRAIFRGWPLRIYCQLRIYLLLKTASVSKFLVLSVIWKSGNLRECLWRIKVFESARTFRLDQQHSEPLFIYQSFCFGSRVFYWKGRLKRA